MSIRIINREQIERILLDYVVEELGDYGIEQIDMDGDSLRSGIDHILLPKIEKLLLVADEETPK